ncbi:MAG: hypothetical protein JWO97_2531 [Acidobacteria bacterium]|nr:hypothetical protein [Acidobacteriota bacterium]
MPRQTAILFCAFAFIALASSAAATRNDNSCDISVTPAATLLLPFFEVDLNSNARTTLFSIINASPQPQIAQVTLWTDWAYPAYSFDLFLTGYDVQSVNLRDVFAGAIPSTPASAAPGDRSQSTNLNQLPSMGSDCSQRPAVIPATNLDDLRTLFTTGRTNSCGTTRIGGPHVNAIGYATIDVVATCSPMTAADPSWFSSKLLFDNVLTGDYERIDSDTIAGNYAGGSPLVHIRAIPEGGPAGSIVGTNLPFTFYDRLTGGIIGGPPRTVDRRQPLPSTFALHYVEGGTKDFQTRALWWREAVTGSGATCRAYADNSWIPYLDVIRFDEHENSYTYGPPPFTPPPGEPGWQVSSRILTGASVFPSNVGTADVAGWIYFNAGNRGSYAYSTARKGFAGGPTFIGPRNAQSWITVEMSSEGRFSVMYDAAALANGCSVVQQKEAQIGPGANTTP